MARPADKVGRRDWLVGRDVLQKALHNRLGYSYDEAYEIVSVLYDTIWRALLNGRRIRLGPAGTVRCRVFRPGRMTIKDRETGMNQDIKPLPSVFLSGKLQPAFKEAWCKRYVDAEGYGYHVLAEWASEDEDGEGEDDGDEGEGDDA